jgi:hypothetical protein
VCCESIDAHSNKIDIRLNSWVIKCAVTAKWLSAFLGVQQSIVKQTLYTEINVSRTMFTHCSYAAGIMLNVMVFLLGKLYEGFSTVMELTNPWVSTIENG